MKTIAIIAIAAALGALAYTSFNMTSQTDAAYEQYIAKYGRNIASQSEFAMRKSIFEANLKKINEHNASGKSWTVGLNKFADWTDEEYSRLLGLKNTQGMNSNLPLFKPKTPYKSNGQDVSIDWTTDTCFVGPVKNQGQCGSCWAFSATQATEAAYCKKFGEKVYLSESQLVDCDFFSHGCNGGLQENAYAHYFRVGPIAEDNYSYEAKDRTCQEPEVASDYPVLPKGFRVDVGDDLLYEALQYAPVAISIRAENDAFRHYDGGVIDGDDCGTYIDHAVLLTGYDQDGDYWIVKNSWGENWGENGYVRIARKGGKGICGINQQNSLPVYEDDF